MAAHTRTPQQEGARSPIGRRRCKSDPFAPSTRADQIVWTLPLLRTTRRRYLDGESVADLAAEVGCSEKALTGAWSHHGISRAMPSTGHKRHDWTMAQLRRIHERWMDGATLRALADEAMAHEATLTSALERAGLRSPTIIRQRAERDRYRRNGDMVAKAYRLRCDSPMTWPQVAAAVGWDRSPVTLRAQVCKYADRVGIAHPPKRSRSGRVMETE